MKKVKDYLKERKDSFVSGSVTVTESVSKARFGIKSEIDDSGSIVAESVKAFGGKFGYRVNESLVSNAIQTFGVMSGIVEFPADTFGVMSEVNLETKTDRVIATFRGRELSERAFSSLMRGLKRFVASDPLASAHNVVADDLRFTDLMTLAVSFSKARSHRFAIENRPTDEMRKAVADLIAKRDAERKAEAKAVADSLRAKAERKAAKAANAS